MNIAQMIVVMMALAVLVDAYLSVFGIEISFLEALAGLAVLKGIALFLVPEKAPMVLVRNTEEE